MRRTLNGGSFNLRYGRDPERVVAEVSSLFTKHRLDFLAVQEFSDYRNDFNLTPFGVIPTSGQCESGIITRPGLPVDNLKTFTYGNGWTTVRGGHAPSAVHNQARLDGWLTVRSVHLPTPSDWRNGVLIAPPDRADDLRATMRGLRIFLTWPSIINARLVAGDWNEPPDTAGRHTPRWLSRATRSQFAVPESREGHGRIDYTLAKGCRVVDIFKDTELPEASDHEPVVFRVVKGRR